MAKKSIPVGAPQPWPLPSSTSSSSSSSPPPSSSYGEDKSYRGCVPGVCSFSCPEWCGGTLIFPPPPPLLLDSTDGGGDSGGRISPLMAALIAVLAAAFLLLFYYTVVSRFCCRRRRRRFHHRQIDDVASADARIDAMVQDPTRTHAGSGLDDSFIRQITVFKYRRSDGLIDGTDCAVCLSEFKEEENLRLMPNCEHAFHIPCIDTWLRTHSNCPLCRATMNPTPPARPGSNPGDPNLNRNGGRVSVAAMQIQRSNDAVLVILEDEGDIIVCHEEVVVEEGEERENGEHKPAI